MIEEEEADLVEEEVKRRSTKRSETRRKLYQRRKRGGVMRGKFPGWQGVRVGILSEIRIVSERDFIIMTQRRCHWTRVKKSEF